MIYIYTKYYFFIKLLFISTVPVLYSTFNPAYRKDINTQEWIFRQYNTIHVLEMIYISNEI